MSFVGTFVACPCFDGIMSFVGTLVACPCFDEIMSFVGTSVACPCFDRIISFVGTLVTCPCFRFWWSHAVLAYIGSLSLLLVTVLGPCPLWQLLCWLVFFLIILL